MKILKNTKNHLNKLKKKPRKQLKIAEAKLHRTSSKREKMNQKLEEPLLMLLITCKKKKKLVNTPTKKKKIRQYPMNHILKIEKVE